MLLREFGSEYLGWEPETCWLEIGRSWGTTISEVNRNKIQAIRTCHVSDSPYNRWEIFEKVVLGFVGLTPKFDIVQRPTPHRAALALDIMSQLREDAEISSEVYKYVAAVMLDYGLSYGPGSLEPSNPYLVEFINSSQQDKVKRALDMKRKPMFNGKNEDDVQIMKSTSVKDFLEAASGSLLVQIKKLLP